MVIQSAQKFRDRGPSVPWAALQYEMGSVDDDVRRLGLKLDEAMTASARDQGVLAGFQDERRNRYRAERRGEVAGQNLIDATSEDAGSHFADRLDEGIDQGFGGISPEKKASQRPARRSSAEKESTVAKSRSVRHRAERSRDKSRNQYERRDAVGPGRRDSNRRRAGEGFTQQDEWLTGRQEMLDVAPEIFVRKG